MLTLALIYLGAALIAVPIAKRLGLGSVLGYLIAGILIGPFVLSLVGDQTEVMHFAEFGVVMMLFLIGLELQPSRLWTLRHSIVGLGGLQVLLSTGAIFAITYYGLGLAWQSALAIGLMLALSSTAIVIQSLEEKGWLKLDAGQNSFSVLLFQDIAVIPILALMPLLSFLPASAVDGSSHSLVSDWSAMGKVGISIAVIVTIILAGKYISTPIFRYISQTHMREIFTVFALFLVIAIALLMQTVGLSPALGTFLAGVVLAESEFRHELEADIEPFKGLLLGLFFVTVGASIDFGLLAENSLLILLLVVGLVAIKGLVLYGLAHLFSINSRQRLLFTLALAQGGEFAFVLLSLSRELSILSSEEANIVTLVVALSMVITPLLLMIYDRAQKFQKSSAPAFDKPEEIEASRHVIIAGYGRFGQVIGRLLKAQGYEVSVLDHSPSQIDLLRRFGNKVFYGDAARKELLEAAGANTADLLVIAIDDPHKTIEIIDIARKHYPNLKLAVRARDRRHAYELIRMKVGTFNRETFDSALVLAVESLKLLGNDDIDAERAGRLFREHDVESMNLLAELWGDDHSYGVAIKQRMDDLTQVLAQDTEAKDKFNTCDSTVNPNQAKEE
ncbi:MULTISPECIES: monovalent cation:proton antiporter-2 (CPA2) family protein [Alteromonas]|jgi:glutathione-regulated potassium-efflux system ancillary protein KefC|uniref:Monovalent cation:proton antiporter-2 (CPA2) family protein n=1 Tax=Alteromonas stellipolaris TaxID=233316 RepID=A0AAW7Z3M7_9ALTE|nr:MULTISPECIES: monovalent cation:proton antiporter-2 (CPA2) family protein [Alteromonas]AMJ91931.1 potassium transporter [Alteromonas sp. Mac2]ALM89203.1 Glutathione-regulated potassium-efflux system protein KefC [Alteromonas stellipolaris LMG 21856]AMJ75644.1 potassium transporter [Alteromonas stellipolaris]AMJ88068.1 potassium transporter [Alteromonas sp. Mac1]AMJ95746.1 potassium transporter [Alteromonas stellipolaris]